MASKIWSLLPYSQDRNILRFYMLTALNSSFFIAGNWIFFWTRFLTFGQLGIVDALAFSWGLLMEVPTGAVADLIGKKKTILASCLLCFVGITFLIAPTNSFWPLLIGFLLAQTGWALYSGSAEALAYDSLKEANSESGFDVVMARSNMISIIVTVITTLAGGLMYVYWFRLPHFAWGTVYLLGFITSFWLREPKVDTEKFSIKAYTAQLSEGAKQLVKPKLLPLLSLIFSLGGFFYLFSYGLIKPVIATQFGFLANQQAVIWATIGIITAIAVYFIPKIMKKIDDKAGLLLLNLLLGIGFLGAALPLGTSGFFVLLLIGIVGSLSTPWISVVVNREIESKYRATTISTISLVSKIPYVVAAVLAGTMIDGGTFWLFNLSVGIIICLVSLTALLSHKNSEDLD